MVSVTLGSRDRQADSTAHRFAHQSQMLLDSGRKFCFLYTNLANPTSDAIYERIGYERIADSAMIRFTPPD